MNGLFFSTYLHAYDDCYTYEEDRRGSLVEDLLISCVSEKEREAFRYAIDRNSSTITQYFSGRRIPPEPIRVAKFQSKNIAKYVRSYFAEDFIENIPETSRNVVKGRVVQLIKKDRTMPVEKKNELLLEAEGSDLTVFLADALIYAVTQPKPEDKFKFYFPNPPVHNLPNIHSKYFVGRDEELSQIKKNFETGIQYQSLSGISGSGKTQLALEFALWEFDGYNYIWWINCASEETMLTSYTEIAQKLKLGNKDDDPKFLMREVQSWCQSNGFWLMILDNVQYGRNNHPYDLKPFLPPITNTGHVVFTTLNDTPYGDETMIKVGLFDEVTGKEFIKERLNLKDVPTGTDRLTARLGGLPLAIEEACAYLSATPSETIDSYMGLLDKYQLGFSDELIYNNAHEQTLLEVTTLAVDRIKKEQSRKLLAMLSYFSEGGIHTGFIGLIQSFATESRPMSPILAPFFEDDLRLQKSLKPLQELALCKPDYTSEEENTASHLGRLQKIYCHKLTQEIVREHFDSDGSGAVLGLELCTSAIQHCSAMTGDYYPLVPDILAFLSNAENKLRRQQDVDVLKKAAKLYRFATWALPDEDKRQKWLWGNHIYFTEKAYGYESIQTAYAYLEYFEMLLEERYEDNFRYFNDAMLLICDMSEAERTLKHPVYEKHGGYPALMFGDTEDVIDGADTMGGMKLLAFINASFSIVSENKDKTTALKYSTKQHDWLTTFVTEFASVWNSQAEEDDDTEDIDPVAMIQQFEDIIRELAQ